MLTAYITHADCALHDMGAGHPECAGRLSAVNDHLLASGLLDLLLPVDAPLATRSQLLRAHGEAHVDSILLGGPTEGYRRVDPDTQMNPHTARAALRSAGAALAGVDLVLDGAAQSAFCATRPPGHHAERSAAMGFCFFNNAAIGALHALEERGLSRVALLDFDVHHGNGSEDIFKDDPRVLMCSTYELGLYPRGDGALPEGSNMVHAGLPPRSGGAAFRSAVSELWLPAIDAFAPELIVVSAGFDGHRDDDMGNLGLLEADYEWATLRICEAARKHCRGRVVSCLEGGYALGPLARSAGAHVRALVGAD